MATVALCEPGLAWVGYSQAKLRKVLIALPSTSVASLSTSPVDLNSKVFLVLRLFMS